MATLHKDLSTIFIIYCSNLLRMEKVWDKAFREIQNTHVMCNIFFFENPTFYKIIFKTTVALGIIWRMHISCWISKATHEQSQYVIRIAFLLQQWLHESASILRYTYISFLVGNTVCPTRYRNRHFFNNSKFEQKYVRCVGNEEECVCSAPNCCDTKQRSASQPAFY
jgi:hypothetical protein